MTNMCSKCGKYPAIIYISKIENNIPSQEGLCVQCARGLNIPSINQSLDNMMGQLGLSDEELDELNGEMSDFITNPNSEFSPENLKEMLDDMSDENIEEGGAPTAPLDMFKKFLSPNNNIKSNSDNSGSENSSNRKENKNAQNKKNSKKKSMLDTYGTNLTAKAAMGKVDRVVNRNDEIDRVVQILNRRTKNNPVILGEPGVGKTAIAEGLACRIFEKNVPPKLFGYQLYLLDFTAIVAGTQFRGQFEARLKNLLSEASEMGNVILVIDEIHNIVAAGDADGAMSAANILKPALARGEIQIIGATTLGEYRKHIEKDSALERRFQPVLVDEPTVDESIEILKGIKDYYENYHHVKISDKIISDAVKLSERYITDRFLPDKAIDVIDEAGSRVNLKNKALYDIRLYNDELEQNKAASEKAAEESDFEKIAQLKSKDLQLQELIKEATVQADNAEITFDDICAVIEGWTKIPIHTLTEDETHKLLHLEEKLHERVIGQNEAIETVSRAIRRGRADISVKKRPVSFIFAGPTGVGKTELVKTIAETMFGQEEALIRFDMSEFMEKHSVSKLIGSPPGYVGYDDAGQLTEKVRRKPYSVILLDEIEKAHPEIFNLFLQILDDGKVSDSHGKMVNFENTIIIMTTNAGSEFKSNGLGFGANEDVTLSDNIDKSLKQQFRPEFLNRIDEIVTFKPLTKDELLKICDLLLKDIKTKLSEKNITLTVTVEAKNIIIKNGYDVKYGARPLRRSICRLLEDKLAKLVLTGQITNNSNLLCEAENDELTIKVL